MPDELTEPGRGVSRDVNEWITYFEHVDGGPGFGVCMLLDEIDRLREQRAAVLALADELDGEADDEAEEPH